MSDGPGVHARPHTFQGQPHVLICRGHLATMKVRMDEAVALANQLIDLVEQQENQ